LGDNLLVVAAVKSLWLEPIVPIPAKRIELTLNNPVGKKDIRLESQKILDSATARSYAPQHQKKREEVSLLDLLKIFLIFESRKVRMKVFQTSLPTSYATERACVSVSSKEKIETLTV
jgi:hypothetical protein